MISRLAPTVSRFMPVFVIVFSRVLGALAAVAVNVILARSLDVVELANVLTTISIVTIVTLFVTLGIESGTVRIRSNYKVAHNFGGERGFIWFTDRFVLALGIVLLAVCLIGIFLAPIQPGSFLSERLVVIALVALPLGMVRVNAALSLSDDRARAATIPRQFAQPVFFLLGSLLIWALAPAPTATDYLVVYGSSVVSVCLVQWALAKRVRMAVIHEKPVLSEWKMWVATGLYLGVPGLLTNYGRDLTNAMSLFFAIPAAEIATIAIALKITAFFRFTIIAVNQVFAAKLGDAIATGNENEVDYLLATGTLLKVAMVTVIMVVILICGGQILAFFSDELRNGRAVLSILMLETVALIVCGPAALYMSLGKGHRVLIILALVSVVVLATGIAFLGEPFGAIGVAWAFSGSWMVWAVCSTLYVYRKTGRDVSILSALRFVTQRQT